jgi:hypothetical protein
MNNFKVTTAGNMREFIIPIDEQVAIVSGTANFGVTAFSINPGNPTCFPFASRTAQNYERYEFQNLRFEYKPSASVFATVGAQGFVGVTATMDALQATPSSQAQSEVMYHSPVVETARPTGLTLPKEFLLTKSLRERFFVRGNGILPPGAEPHLFDCGQVFIWTNGQANTNQIGEFRVIGSCKLMNPVLETSVNPPPQFNSSQFINSALTPLASTVGNVLAFADSTPAHGYVNALGIIQAGGSFVPQAGNYLVSAEANFASSGNSTLFQLSIQKNAGAITTSNPNTIFQLPSGAYPAWAVAIPPTFVQCNGTDALTVVATSNFSTGASTAQCTFTIQAV